MAATRVANEGVGGDASAPLAERVDELVHHGFLDALAGATPKGARALEEALAKRLD